MKNGVLILASLVPGIFVHLLQQPLQQQSLWTSTNFTHMQTHSACPPALGLSFDATTYNAIRLLGSCTKASSVGEIKAQWAESLY